MPVKPAHMEVLLPLPSQPHPDLNQALQALAAKSIQADTSHLVESIRRQFADPYEFVRELIANGLDAGATQIRVIGQSVEGEKFPLQIRFEDDGKGIGRKDVERYLTVFESFKDGDGAMVGRHGVGKLSPWADPLLGTYTVDTCDGKERTILSLESVHHGVMQVYPAAGRTPGTAVILAWPANGPDELVFRMERVVEMAERYCSYAARPVWIKYQDHLLEQAENRQIVRLPENDGWVALDALKLPRGQAKLWFRMGGSWGVHLYQGGLRLCSDGTALNPEDREEDWSLPGLEFMADSQAFDVPISRNAVKRNGDYFALGRHLRENVVPALVDAACRRFGQKNPGLDQEQDENLVIAFLEHDTAFRPAQDLPLFPVFPFGKASLNQLAAWHARQGSLSACRLDAGPLDAPPQTVAEMLDAQRLTSSMRRVLEARFGPVAELDFDKEVIELSEKSQDGRLSALEARFQGYLSLLKTPVDGFSDSEEEDESFASRLLDVAFRRLGKLGRHSEVTLPDGANIEVPNIRFRLGRLVKMDGVTPAVGRRFLQQGRSVVLNLYHPELERHMCLAAKDPNLAAHWCLRELLLSGEVEQLRHLSNEMREALIQGDAAARCAVGLKSGERESPKREPNQWSDDEDEWRRFGENK